MKFFFILLNILPLFAVCQVKHVGKQKHKVTVTEKTQPSDGFIITGVVTGFQDGTNVSFLNEQTGLPEQQATIQKEKFVIQGKVDQPGIRGLIFADQQPLIPIFLDNSTIQINGSKEALDKLIITGSPSHTQFLEFTNAIKPYEKQFMPDADRDSLAIVQVEKISEDFVKKYPSSYVSPLAIIRLYQATENGVKAEELYSLLPDKVKESPLGLFVNQQVQEFKINPIGSRVADFSQADTAGNAISLTSFKGKYVLLDFWASWCRPCRIENPNVVVAYNKFKDRNFTVLGISLDQAKPAWINAIKMDGLTWSHVSDLKGWGNAVAAQFQVKSIPQNLLLDPEGRIIGKNLRGPALVNRLNTLFK